MKEIKTEDLVDGKKYLVSHKSKMEGTFKNFSKQNKATFREFEECFLLEFDEKIAQPLHDCSRHFQRRHCWFIDLDDWNFYEISQQIEFDFD